MKKAIFGAIILAVLLFLFFHFMDKDFNTQSFMGHTERGTIVVLDLKSKGGKLTGKGLHFFSRSGVLNKISLKNGTIDIWGNIKFKEVMTEDGALFGKVEGVISRDLQTIDCEWVNSKGTDPTPLILEQSDQTSEEVLNAIMAELEKRRQDEAQAAALNTETLVNKTGDLIDAVAKETGSWMSAIKNSFTK